MEENTLNTADFSVDYPVSPFFYQKFPFQIALEWSLVLNALAIEHILLKVDESWMLIIDIELLELGETEIQIYNQEINTPSESVISIDYFPVNKPIIISFFLSFLLFHIFISSFGSDRFYNLGELSTQRVLNGEWWRAVTSLTLHADFQHLAMNTVFGITFITVLSFLTGTEFAISLTIISGLYGNLINAFLHKYDYHSIGFSTAVFGTLGLIAGMQLFGKYKLKPSAKIIVVISTILFFGLFGIGGERVDAGAHLMGLFSGLIIGGITSFWDLVRYKGFHIFKHIIFTATILTIIICWLIQIKAISLVSEL